MDNSPVRYAARWSPSRRRFRREVFLASRDRGAFVRPGVELLDDVPGPGEEVQRHRVYDIRLRIWLSRGEPVRWKDPLSDRLEDDGTTLFTALRVDREQMIAGLFYGVEGMKVGGTRRIRVAPHLAYRERGVPGVIPPNALLIIEVAILAERT